MSNNYGIYMYRSQKLRKEQTDPNFTHTCQATVQYTFKSSQSMSFLHCTLLTCGLCQSLHRNDAYVPPHLCFLLWCFTDIQHITALY